MKQINLFILLSLSLTLTSKPAVANGTSISLEKFKSQISIYQSKTVEAFRMFHILGLTSKRVLDIEPQLSRPLPANEKKDHEVARRLYIAMFSDPSKTEQILKKIKVDVNSTGSCKNREGQDVDVSIHGTKTYSVCMSWPRLQGKLNVDNFETELFALYSREVSRFLGAKEDEAAALQEMVQRTGSKFKDYFSADSEITSEADFSELHEILNQIQPSLPDTKVCRLLNDLYFRLYDQFMEDHLKTQRAAQWPFQQVVSFHASFIISGFAKDYCETDISLTKMMRSRKFPASKVAPIRDLYPDPLLLVPPIDSSQVLIYSQYLLADMAKAQVAFNSKGDRKALEFNLNQLRQQFRYLQ